MIHGIFLALSGYMWLFGGKKKRHMSKRHGGENWTGVRDQVIQPESQKWKD